MSDKAFAEREANIKQQEHRRKRLKSLADIFHRCRSGGFTDYEDTYEEFEEQYLSPRHEHIPRYASCAEDESYGMISLFESITDAVNDQADITDSGEYLNVPVGVYDLDCYSLDPTDDRRGGRVSYRMIAMTEEAHAIICGIVAGSAEGIDGNDIYSEAWEELRERFPLKQFHEYAKKAGEEFYTA